MERARGILGIARAAVATLKDLGLSDAAVDRLADQAGQALGAPGNPDGITVEATLTSQLRALLPADRLAVRRPGLLGRPT